MAAKLTNLTKRRPYRAVSLIEVLLALAICSTMLAALVVSIRAMTSTVNANESYARLTMKGRNAMMRIIDQVRTADAHLPYSTSSANYTAYLDYGQTMNDIGIQFADAGVVGPDSTAATAVTYTYWWDQTKQQVLVQKSVNGAVVGSGIMLDGVTNFQVTMWPGKSNSANPTYDVMLRATFLIQYTDTDPTNKTPQTLTLSGSVVPRKNVWSGRKLSYPIQTYLTRNF